MKTEERLKLSQQATERAGVVILGLAMAKAIVGTITGSTILLSDSVHSLSDLVSIVASWLGIKMSQKEKTKKFPYGYFKAENIATLMVSGVIGIIGISFFKEGWGQLWQSKEMGLPAVAIGMGLAGASTDWFLGQYLAKIAKKTKSSSVDLAAKDKKSDAMVSLGVLAGLVLTAVKIGWAEGVVTMIIAILILKVGFEGAKEAVLSLMDAGVENEDKEKVKKAVQKVEGVEECLEVTLRKSGPVLMGEVKVGIRKKINLNQAETIRKKVRQEIKKAEPMIEKLTIEIKDFVSDYKHVVLPVNDKAGLESELADTFARCNYLLFVNIKKNKIIGFYFLENRHKKDKTKAGLAVAKMTIKQKSGVVICKKIGEIADLALKNNLFDIYKSRSKTAKKAIEIFLK